MTERLSYLPAAVSVSTSVTDLCPLETTNICSSELAECFIQAQQSNTHTRPVPSVAKEIRHTLDKLDSFNSSHLDIFLRAYMFAGNLIPNSLLDQVRLLCVNSNREWVTKCQNLALRLLTSELQAKKQDIIPRCNIDEPLSLSQLRSTLPKLKDIPEITIGTCHFCFVGNFGSNLYDHFTTMQSSDRPEYTFDNNDNNCSSSNNSCSNTLKNKDFTSESNSSAVYTAKIKLTNSGRHTVTLSVWQTQTVIDGINVENRFVETSIEKQILKSKESMSMTLTLKKAPRAGFSDFQQLIVLGVDGVLKVFVTFTVICPRQIIFHQCFPNCLPLHIVNSPIGTYDAPLMLQILKHILIKQKGLSDPSVANLLTCSAASYTSQNKSIVMEAVHVQEILAEQVNITEVLESFWNSQKVTWKGNDQNNKTQLPLSAAQPAGYLPGIDLPTIDNISNEHNYFPNADTRLPDILTRAPAPVIMCLIMLWICSLNISVFDASFVNCDPIIYLETTAPHIRGVLLWVIDLCCALLVNAPVNGCTVRNLAITFAAVLDHSAESSINEITCSTKICHAEHSVKSALNNNKERVIADDYNATKPSSIQEEHKKDKDNSVKVVNVNTGNDIVIPEVDANNVHCVVTNIIGLKEHKNVNNNSNSNDDSNKSNVIINSKESSKADLGEVKHRTEEVITLNDRLSEEKRQQEHVSEVSKDVGTFQTSVAFRQNIVTALLTWISLYRTRYDAMY